MIVYSATRAEFIEAVLYNRIADQVKEIYVTRLGRNPAKSEVRSWRNSFQYMKNVLTVSNLPDDAGVAIEYQIPPTSKRIDFLLSGLNESGRDALVVVELKQWDLVKPTQKDAVVKTILGGSLVETTHPSFQAWTYQRLIQDFNVVVQEGDITLNACAFLHNCSDGSVLNDDFYRDHTQRAPVFLKDDVGGLAKFFQKHVHEGDRTNLLDRIEKSPIKPSKNLADHLSNLLQGNDEFVMIDDQKVVYESVLSAAEKSQSKKKQVVLIEGGPGTGKSVVAVNLLVELINRDLHTQYVTRNSAPREVYQSKLVGTLKKTHIANLFKGSGSFIHSTKDSIDCLLVDEAHRLTARSGMFKAGENQVAEIINSSKCSAFFLDEDQRVHIDDIGDREVIRSYAAKAGAELVELKLESQFRCNGSDGYIAWLDHALGIRSTANQSLDGIDYDFQVVDSPNELNELIKKKDSKGSGSRLLAGYCWDWEGKKDPNIKDVVIPEHNFAMRWNLSKDGMLWILEPDSISEIGCIHTCQGLEMEYAGVIIGRDFMVKKGRIVTDVEERSKQDYSVRGIKTMRKEDPKRAKEVADSIIKNTYRTLMSRGQKGCYVFCVDKETNEYFKRAIRGNY